ncbi:MULTISPECIES: DUF3575 domain-containing protein [unclassified Dysgonomonas]|uniref:DUF3575 domain-containing protein n=1 Tax=unclassified Dysgonomonas TaxID=2630389 RepID=UPI002473F162|nr:MULTISPECIES: DUF3575 domain-containing protein [unclassified Dysgonomonas]
MFRRTFLFWCGIIYVAGSLEASTVAPSSAFVEVSLNTANTGTKQTFGVPSSETVRIYYRVNRTEIDSGYMGNAKTLSLIKKIFAKKTLEKDDFIVITSTASPEGGFDNNQRLAKERALSLRNYIMQINPRIKDNQVIMLPHAEDWDGLKEMIEKDKDVPARSQLLYILNSNLSDESKKLRIMKIGRGKPYGYLLKNILPHLRGSATGTIYTKKDERFAKTDTVEIFRFDTVFVDRVVVRVDTVCPEKQRRPFVMAVKSNLLYDAALLPNLAVEIPFGRNYNWSVGIEGNWSWWNTNASNYYYHRIQIAGVEMRRWFGNRTGKPLNGWFVGAYGYGGTYDIRLFTNKNSDEGQLSNWSYSGGLTFGYAISIAKRFNLEFGIGAGYFGGKYYKYTVGACDECIFPWKSTHQRNYIGLTKANISLVWLIGNVFGKNKGKENQR